MSGNSQANSNDSHITRNKDKKNNKNQKLLDCLPLIIAMLTFAILGAFLWWETRLIEKRYELANKLLKQAAELANHKRTVILDLEGIHFEIRKTEEGLNNKGETTKDGGLGIVRTPSQNRP